jgi:hypothetical protein
MRFFKKYQLEPFVKLEHEVLSGTWDESGGTCKILQTAKTVA